LQQHHGRFAISKECLLVQLVTHLRIASLS
jgi:hypothetical protein